MATNAEGTITLSARVVRIEASPPSSMGAGGIRGALVTLAHGDKETAFRTTRPYLYPIDSEFTVTIAPKPPVVWPPETLGADGVTPTA